MFLSIAETIVVRSLLICGVRTYCSVCGCVCVFSCCVCVFFLNSRTYAQYFETILPSRKNEVYLMGGGAAGGL